MDFIEENNDISVNVVDAITLVVRMVTLIILNYYLEGNGFRRIERLMGVSHVSVINWVKQLAYKFKNIPKRCEKVYVLELDEMCVSSKKKYGFGLL